MVETPYLNTIHPSEQGAYPGDLDLEERLHGVVRWNAMMMVTRANKYFEGIGGHISTYAQHPTPGRWASTISSTVKAQVTTFTGRDTHRQASVCACMA